MIASDELLAQVLEAEDNVETTRRVSDIEQIVGRNDDARRTRAGSEADGDDPVISYPDDDIVEMLPPPRPPMETAVDLDTPHHKRRASGPRRRTRVTLTTDAVRDAIEQRYREEGSWEALIELYRNRIEVAEAAKEKNELFKRIAEVFVRELDDGDQAFDALLEAIALDPLDEETVIAFEDVARRYDGWKKLVDALAKRLEATTDEDVELRFAELLTRWCRHELRDLAGAEPFLARVRKLDPGNPLVHRHMASAYRELGAWDAQRDALERVLASVKRDVDRKLTHLSLGELFEQRLHSYAKAQEHYDAALALDAGCMEALRGLERLCRVEEKLPKLADVLERQVDAAETNDERIAVLVRLADLHERHFVKPQTAASRLELVLELDPKHQGALEALERCYHRMRAWGELVSTIERRVTHTDNPLEKCDFLMRLAEVHESKLGDVDAALGAYRRVYELDSGHKQALVELARLSERQKDWSGAAAYRGRVAELTDDPKAKAQIHTSVAEMLAHEDRDLACARGHFDKAVQMDPTNVAAWEGLQKLAMRAGDGMHATFCLEKRAHHTDSARMKAQLLVELAKMRAALGDARGTFTTYDYAIKVDPTNESAARAVFEEYVDTQRWTDASRVCELLVNAATRDGDNDRLFKLLGTAAKIALALGNADRALIAALAAFELRPDDARARSRVIDLCHELRSDEKARAKSAAAIERILAESHAPSPDSLAKLGEIQLAAGDDAAAVETLCRALALDADHCPALKSLAEVFARRGDWHRASNCKQRLAQATEDPEAQRALLLEAAELWETRAKNLPKAALLLEEALATRPEDAVLLHRLVSLYQSLQLWEKLTSALRAIAYLEQDQERKAKTLYAMAGIVRERIGDERRAAMLYDEVLDLDAERLEAFEHIVRIYTEARAFADLAAAYVRMITRVQGRPDTGLKHALHHQLALIYRDRLGDTGRALDAFRCAANLKPESDDDRRSAVELLVVMERTDVAIGTMRAAIRRDPLRAAHYRDLYQLFLRDGAVDKAWCAVDVIGHLEAADDEESRFLHEYPPCELDAIPGTLASGAWSSHIFHEGLDARLSAILRIVAPAILRMRFEQLTDGHRQSYLGKRLHEGDSETAANLVRLVQTASEILGIPTPDLYDRPSMPMPFAVAPTPKPSLFVSVHAAESMPSDLLPFLVARRIGELRPEMLSHALFPTVAELKGLLKASVRVALTDGPSREKHALKPEETALANAIPAKDMETLREAVSTVLGGAERVEPRRWLQLADVSLSRVGLLLAGDFGTSFRAMQREARAPGDLAAAEWRREMLSFAVSDEYAELRGAIGVSLEGEA